MANIAAQHLYTAVVPPAISCPAARNLARRRPYFVSKLYPVEILTFQTQINAPARTVWATITDPAAYREWIGTAFPGSRFEGNWREGETIRFVGDDGSGTLARLTRVVPFRTVEAEHVGLLGPDGTLDTTSEQARGWIGTRENYYLEADGAGTRLRVEMHTAPEWTGMFRESWPTLLEKLREMCEHRITPAQA